MEMYPKVNTDAIVSAVMRQKNCYHQTTCFQYKSIVYIAPGVYYFDVEDIVAISIRLTGRWDEATVTGPEYGSKDRLLRLIVSISNLLPEFIIEDEFLSDETDNPTTEDDEH